MKKVFVEGASLIQSISHFSSCLLLTFRQIGGVRAFAEGANERKNEMKMQGRCSKFCPYVCLGWVGAPTIFLNVI